MAGSTNFPTSTDTFAKATPTYQDDEDTTGRVHSERHDDMEAAMEAVQDYTLAEAAIPVLPSVVLTEETGSANWTSLDLPEVSAAGGDWLVVWAHSNIDDRTLGCSDDTGLTWTQQGQAIVGAVKMAVWVAEVVDSGPVTVTCTQSGTTSGGCALALVRGATAVDLGFETTPSSGNTTTPTATSMDVAANTLALLYAATGNGTDGATCPEDWTEHERRVYSSGRAHSLASAGFADAGETGAIVFTSPSDTTNFAGISIVGEATGGTAPGGGAEVHVGDEAPTGDEVLWFKTDASPWAPFFMMMGG